MSLETRKKIEYPCSISALRAYHSGEGQKRLMQTNKYIIINPVKLYEENRNGIMGEGWQEKHLSEKN
jgi:hypothetical protein